MCHCVCVCVCVDLNLGVIGVHAAKTAANLAIEGNYTDSRMSAMSQQRLVQRWRLT